MSDLENPLPESSELDDLKEHYAALGSQVNTLLIAITVVSLTLTAFIGLQSHRTGSDVRALRPQVNQLMEGYQRQQPALKNFVTQLVQYGKTHPDFEPIVKKYNLTEAATSAASATPAAPAPAKK